MALNGGTPDLIRVVIDGKEIRVPKGTNIIEAAKLLGIEIPHYCYHPNLSIAGNCRMCQVKVVGAPKMDIACNILVREGMEIQTHLTSKEVEDAQAAVLEFILINHPLDCTVCDQAGHCKLQDYHYEYNARPSRFVEDKVHKVKAEPLGPNVILDGERCIMCTRCVRFCDEVTKTSELGMLERGDRSVIAINRGKELNNPLSGTVVDLCPVGALTHRNWRFNTRIWYTKETPSICPGCSTGCNVNVAIRDGEVVQVKARMNQEVNKEWLCDEGRYGFMRFLPKTRRSEPAVLGKSATWEQALTEAKRISTAETLVFLAPDLLLEEYTVISQFLERCINNRSVVVAYRERKLSEVEAILISPDYAANFRGAEYSGVVKGALATGTLQSSYERALEQVRSGSVKSVLAIGERAFDWCDRDPALLQALAKIDISVAIACDSEGWSKACKVVFPGRSILEKSGILVNRAARLQYAQNIIGFPAGSEPEWRVIARMAEGMGAKIVNYSSDRELTNWYLTEVLSKRGYPGVKIAQLKAGGLPLKEERSEAVVSVGTEMRA